MHLRSGPARASRTMDEGSCGHGRRGHTAGWWGLLGVLLSLAGASGCNRGEPAVLQFAAQVGDKPFRCGMSYPGLGTSGSTFTPSDLRFYVSEVRLIRADGTEVPAKLEADGKWQGDGVALLDFEDKQGPCINGTVDVNDKVHIRAPEGPYQGIRFTLGVPFAKNHRDMTLAPSPLNLSTMFWGWNGGYKFLRIDGRTTGLSGLEIHVGSTGCLPQAGQVQSCARPNRADIRLGGGDPLRQTIVADLAALVRELNMDQNQPDTPPLCMAAGNDADCGGVFKSLGLSLERGTPEAKLQQTFFRWGQAASPEGR